MNAFIHRWIMWTSHESVTALKIEMFNTGSHAGFQLTPASYKQYKGYLSRFSCATGTAMVIWRMQNVSFLYLNQLCVCVFLAWFGWVNVGFHTSRSQFQISNRPHFLWVHQRDTHAGCWENTRKACKSRAEG